MAQTWTSQPPSDGNQIPRQEAHCLHGYHGELPGASPCHAKIWIKYSTSKYAIINGGKLNIRLYGQGQHGKMSQINVSMQLDVIMF
jgi:hypothetical protein